MNIYTRMITDYLSKIDVIFNNLSKHFIFFCRRLPREVDPLVYNMSHEDPGNITYAEIGGLNEQIRELREVCTVFHQIL